jgi:hypothetical protein
MITMSTAPVASGATSATRIYQGTIDVASIRIRLRDPVT